MLAAREFCTEEERTVAIVQENDARRWTWGWVVLSGTRHMSMGVPPLGLWLTFHLFQYTHQMWPKNIPEPD